MKPKKLRRQLRKLDDLTQHLERLTRQNAHDIHIQQEQLLAAARLIIQESFAQGPDRNNLIDWIRDQSPQITEFRRHSNPTDAR